MKIDISDKIEEFSEQIYSAIDSSRQNLLKFSWAEQASLESTKQFIQEKIKSSDIIFAVLVNGIAAGVIEFRNIQEKIYQCGFWLGNNFRGQGVMGQAFRIAIRELFMRQKIDKLIAKTDPKNIATQTILNRHGFNLLCCDEKWFHYILHMESYSGLD